MGLETAETLLVQISSVADFYKTFTPRIPRNMLAVQKFMRQRPHIGKMRVKVLGWKRDYKTKNITVDVIQADRLAALEKGEGA